MRSFAESPSTPAVRRRRACFAAIATRDARQDGAFVYGVRSTGIYCRPSCPSRRPHPKQIVLFRAPEAANQAGFRPCLRCHPDKAGRDPRSQLVRKICSEIEGESNPRTDLELLAKATGRNANYLQRAFRKAMGVTPKQYADAIRVTCLKSDLRKGKDVTTAMYEAGYGSASRLYEKSNSHLGMSPAVYGRGGRGMKISYAISGCSLGRVLVATTDRGIAAVSLGDNNSRLATELRKEYPHAEIRRGTGAESRWARETIRHLDGLQPRLDLPTDVVATAFQRRVWEALRSIPSGTTRTYTEIARSIGQPTATRAVARACATNPTAIVIPCHRVIRSDGSLGGYRWGLERKKILLDQERKITKKH